MNSFLRPRCSACAPSAVDYLGRIRQLAQRVGDPALFAGLLAEIRVNHKPKRNLMALLGGKRW
jgi:hypothetical protein